MVERMKQWALPAVGRDALRLVEAAVPAPAPGEVLVKVDAISLNYRDKLIIEDGLSLPKPLARPLVPGSDMAGTVVAIGPGVRRFKVDDRVVSAFLPGWIDGPGLGTARTPTSEGLGSGAYQGVLSEYVALDEEWAVRAPTTLGDVEASTLTCAGLTAWTALVERGRVRAGQTVVVQGTGGVAIFGLQIAAAHGAEVIVTSRNAAKLERAKALGAHHAIDRTAEDWVEAVYRVTAERGADHILEIVGGPHLARSMEAAAVDGRISLIGLLEGVDVSAPFFHFALKHVVVEGIQVGHRRALEDFVRAVDRAGIVPVVDATYPFADLLAALDHLDRGPFGKVVVTMS
jgi:NADPH:quinone reductase-like Zn-dependent oxidoreductase